MSQAIIDASVIALQIMLVAAWMYTIIYLAASATDEYLQHRWAYGTAAALMLFAGLTAAVYVSAA